jgi:hypothetical protein
LLKILENKSGHFAIHHVVVAVAFFDQLNEEIKLRCSGGSLVCIISTGVDSTVKLFILPAGTDVETESLNTSHYRPL